MQKLWIQFLVLPKTNQINKHTNQTKKKTTPPKRPKPKSNQIQPNPPREYGLGNPGKAVSDLSKPETLSAVLPFLASGKFGQAVEHLSGMLYQSLDIFIII